MKPTIHYSDCIIVLPDGRVKSRGKTLAKIPLAPPPIPQTIGRITSGPFCWDGILFAGRGSYDYYPVFRDGKQIS